MSDSSPMPSEGLSAADVRRIAKLAKLQLDDAHVDDARTRLDAVLGYMHRLQAIDLSGLEPLTSVGDLQARLRDDEPGPMLSTETFMAMTPSPEAPFIAVPKVIDEGGSGG
jgi:aspartyl-tRNA(Asn)/glutamyl-tRNA(Gln) amidotransferase subunit C